MKHITFAIALCTLLCCANPLSAQTRTFNFGVKGGFEMSELQLNCVDIVADNSTGYFIGPVLNVNLPIAGLGANIAGLYGQHETEINGEMLKQQSLDIPVNLRLSMKFCVASLFVEAGPQLGFALGDRALSFYDNSLGDVNWNEDVADLSFNFGAGLTLLHFQVCLTYNTPLGHTGDFKWSNAITSVTHSSSKVSHWQLSAALFF